MIVRRPIYGIQKQFISTKSRLDRLYLTNAGYGCRVPINYQMRFLDRIEKRSPSGDALGDLGCGGYRLRSCRLRET